VDIRGEQLAEHAEPGADGEREESLPRSAGEFTQRDRDLLGQHQPTIGGRGRLRMLGHVAVPFCRASWRMPDTYHTAGIRRGPPPQVLRRPGQPRLGHGMCSVTVMRPLERTQKWELTSVCAGQWWCGAPRRNRTADPILTMDVL